MDPRTVMHSDSPQRYEAYTQMETEQERKISMTRTPSDVSPMPLNPYRMRIRNTFIDVFTADETDSDTEPTCFGRGRSFTDGDLERRSLTDGDLESLKSFHAASSTAGNSSALSDVESDTLRAPSDAEEYCHRALQQECVPGCRTPLSENVVSGSVHTSPPTFAEESEQRQVLSSAPPLYWQHAPASGGCNRSLEGLTPTQLLSIAADYRAQAARAAAAAAQARAAAAAAQARQAARASDAFAQTNAMPSKPRARPPGVF